MVEDAVAHLLGQVESRARRARARRPPAASARCGVKPEPQRSRSAASSALLAGVAEGRVAEVVAEPDRLGQVLVEAERARDGAGDPAGLQGVGEAGAVVVALGGDEDLGLVLEPAKRLRVDDPVAVALEGRAQRAVGLLDLPLGRVGRRRQVGEELGLPGSYAVLESRRGLHGPDPRAWLKPRSGAARARGARASRRPPARPGAASLSPASGASASGRAIASTMKRCASSESGKAPASQLAQTTPPGGAGEADQVLRLAAARAGGELRREAGGERQLESEGERRLQRRRPLRRRVVEQRQVAAEQVVGGRVGLGRVEQPQHRVAGAGGGGQRRARGAQPRVAVDGGDAGDGEQLAAALVQHQVEPEERLQPPAEARARLPRPLGDRADPSARAPSRGGGCGRPRRSECCAGRPPPSSASFRA